MNRKQWLKLQKIDTAVLRCRDQNISDSDIVEYIRSIADALEYCHIKKESEGDNEESRQMP